VFTLAYYAESGFLESPHCIEVIDAGNLGHG
jgi:hypothetical protein